MDKFLHHLVTSSASIASNIVELTALLLIIYAVLRTIVMYIGKYHMDFHQMHKDDGLIRGLTVALEVLLAGEILKTITASNKDTLVEIFLIILMRVFMTIVLRWEESSKEESHHGPVEVVQEKIAKTVSKKKVKSEE